MSDLVKRLRDRPNDAPMESERLMDEAADRIEALEAALRQAREALTWYVEEDDVLEGDHWEKENAFWIEGKRNAESSIATINDLLKD